MKYHFTAKKKHTEKGLVLLYAILGAVLSIVLISCGSTGLPWDTAFGSSGSSTSSGFGSSTSGSSSTSSSTSGASSTSSNSFSYIPVITLISDEESFQMIRDKPWGNYELTNDIVLTEDFEPIGDDDVRFNGYFNGRGHTISNLRIQKPRESEVGFFGVIGVSGIVFNVKLSLAPGDTDSPSIEGNHFVGALAGRVLNQKNIGFIGVEGGHVKGNKYVGGLVGEIYGDIMTSYVTGDVEEVGLGSVGGLVGRLYGEIENSYATGTVTGTKQVGGLVGNLRHGSKIKNSYATGIVTGAEHVGALVGESSIAFDSDSITANYFNAIATQQWVGTVQGSSILTADMAAPYYVVGDVVRLTNDANGSPVTQTSFDGWDFKGDPANDLDPLWQVNPGEWPQLVWQ